MHPQQAYHLALQKQQAGQFAEAESLYRQAIAAAPRNPQPLNNLGSLLCAMNRIDEAVEIFRLVLKLIPDRYEPYVNMGNALRMQGDNKGAIEMYGKAVALSPRSPDALFALGAALIDQRDFHKAILYFKQAIAARPDFGDAYYNLGLALELLGRKRDAAASYRHAIARAPNLARAYSNLGGLLQAQGDTDEALTLCQRAIQLDPNLPDAHNNLGASLFNSGLIDPAMESYRRASELAPTRSDLASNCLFTPYYDPNCDCSKILPRFESWNQRFAEPQKKFIRPHANVQDAGRRLRIGYVSPNFRAHAETAFVLPLLEKHDHKQFEIFCYSDAIVEDAASVRIRVSADKWRDTAGLGHEALAEQIRADEIDIAIDLTMHMSGGRLESFARKPAPVQVCWLAYPGTTGLTTMDYRLTDSFVDPPGAFASHYTEECFRLPRTFACYDPAGMEPNPPPKRSALTPSPSTPGEGRGEGRASQSSVQAEALPTASPQHSSITFGCLNNVAKLNPEVLARFSAVLKAMPDAMLRLLVPTGEARRVVLERFSTLGIPAARISFVAKQSRIDYMNEFLQIDISLDTLPYCGHTTSLDSMYMGTPVITRIGNSAAGRVGWSLLNNLSLTDLAAHDDEEFVRIAVKLANDRDGLAELRRTLRGRLLDSPIMNGESFARDVEAAYRQMWRRWIRE